MNINATWPELIGVMLLVLGLLVGALSPSAAMTYFIAIVAGIMGGRFLGTQRDFWSPWWQILVGFAIGYTIAAFRGSRVVIVVLLLAAGITSWWWFTYHDYKDTKV